MGADGSWVGLFCVDGQDKGIILGTNTGNPMFIKFGILF